jgi:hypothetical protein
MCKVDEPAAQRIHRENADRMLLSSFVAGLRGEPGKQVRYANPQNIEHALSIALTVEEAEKQEKFNETFYTRFDDSVRLLSQSPSRPRREDGKYRRSADTQAVSHLRSQRYESHETLTRHPTQETAMSRQKPPFGASIVRVTGTFLESDPRG